ncbi:MAG TPA: hypothetical protein DDY73_13825 [Coprobacter fastidiosus]|uniref:DUF6046 domain-containing protein n=1 Tax=Coprobacter fastidiosus TaxID=1099853 RepID=A0A354M6D3_9BACT|nr:hypothetical protein [Coprobacter fastidiosus]
MSRFEIELFDRYQRAFGHVGDFGEALASGTYVSGAIDRSIYTAGIALNNALVTKKVQSPNNCAVDCYTINVADRQFADMVLTVDGEIYRFAFDQSTDVLAPPPLFSFSRSKKTVITVIDRGDENEIVEDFGLQSWEINIDGIIVDMERHQYPGDKVRRLNALCAYRGIIPVSSKLLADMSITAIWIDRQSYDFVEGYPDTVRYNLVAHSAKPAEFNLIVK